MRFECRLTMCVRRPDDHELQGEALVQSWVPLASEGTLLGGEVGARFVRLTRPETPRASKRDTDVVELDSVKSNLASAFRFRRKEEMSLPTLPVFSRTNEGLQSFSC
jgi:hypothetical protein